MYTLPCQLVQAGLPFRPVMDLSILGVTRWSVLTPLRIELRVNAAQSIGEWPGARSTLPLALGGAVAPLTVRPPPPPLTRCAEFAGGPLFGRGPVVGTRSEAGVLADRPAAGFGLAGGAMRPALPFTAGFSDAPDELNALEVRCALFDAGKRGTGGFEGVDCFDVSGALPFRDKAGTGGSGLVATTLGVSSLSSGSVTSIVKWLGVSSSGASSVDVAFARDPSWVLSWSRLSIRRLPGRSHRVKGSRLAGGCRYAKNEIETSKIATLQYAICGQCGHGTCREGCSKRHTRWLTAVMPNLILNTSYLGFAMRNVIVSGCPQLTERADRLLHTL